MRPFEAVSTILENLVSATPLITTVIPTYRRPHLLRRAIRSVLDQSYPHFKICVYDNASEDETAEVVNNLARQDPRIHYHCHPNNIGAQDNFIFGLSRTETPYVHLLSDDDFLLPSFFAQATSALDNNPDAAFFSGGMLSANTDGGVRALLRYGPETDQAYRPPKLFQLLASYTRTWTSAIFRRVALEALGGLKKETSYSFSIDLLLRSATRFEAVLSDAPVAVFTVHAGSSSVAEAKEAFESLLTLRFFESVNAAVDSALRDNIVTAKDALAMKALFRTTMERTLFRGALGMIARQELHLSLGASKLLAEVFNRRAKARIIRLAAMDNRIGLLSRFTLRNIRAARKLWFLNRAATHNSHYSDLVRRRLLELA